MSRSTLTAIIFLLLYSRAWPASIGADCEPKGAISMASEAWDSKAFWSKQLQEISAHVEGERVAYRLTQIERKRDAANSALDAQEMRAMGINPNLDANLQRELSAIDREMQAFDYQRLQSAIAWGEKCTAYARQKLNK